VDVQPGLSSPSSISSFRLLQQDELSRFHSAISFQSIKVDATRELFGISSFYFTWLRISFFATGIATNIDTYAYDNRVTSLGGQADLRMVLLSHLRFTFSVGYAAAYDRGEYYSHLRFTFSVGYAAAYDRGEYYSDEVMVSLKVL
jgi:hypothetical protein